MGMALGGELVSKLCGTDGDREDVVVKSMGTGGGKVFSLDWEGLCVVLLLRGMHCSTSGTSGTQPRSAHCCNDQPSGLGTGDRTQGQVAELRQPAWPSCWLGFGVWF